jgi:hypothetical protein
VRYGSKRKDKSLFEPGRELTGRDGASDLPRQGVEDQASGESKARARTIKLIETDETAGEKREELEIVEERERVQAIQGKNFLKHAII